jgi:2-polyprenyl-3-methyl-5-hydroxy-6-metoxy-1,4-benzoquinol methylase
LDVTTRRQPQKIRHYRSVLEKLYADVSMQDAPHSWLDVGAGYGEFLEAVQARFPACNAMGIEPMEAKCAAAQARGLDVSSTSLEQLTSKFDVVSMINVFSHIPRFDAFLDEIKAKLNEGGEIFLETGNGGDLERRSQYPDPLYLPDHLVFAGETHIAGFLERAGFEVISIARLRTDTLVRCLKNVLKRAAGKGAVGAWPYTSPFRTVMFRARLPAQP